MPWETVAKRGALGSVAFTKELNKLNKLKACTVRWAWGTGLFHQAYKPTSLLAVLSTVQYN